MLPFYRILSVAIASALLAGCADRATAITPQGVSPAQSGVHGAGLDVRAPDVAPPKCKGQKNTKLYAEVASQAMKTKGGTLCVPSFGDWGGALQYPNLNYSQTFTIELISSTKAYGSGSWPPNGSEKPIYYLQYAFSGFPTFGTKLPKGNPLVSKHLEAGKPYTVELWENVIVGWTPMSSCYQKAAKSKFGAGLEAVGAVWEGQAYRESSGVIEVLKGELVTNKC